ncbi:hypothetical protein L1987_09047 [Smallanthus sonchifolius]|uniref:Uncharacterized protein n=1 Tax=Smallanthus sonchifolius TaxID=185202 RepID=A0ACB9JMU7_9ASTR|nr:hypothetical protein L1987_09047 [Smallanthus sonchifolius]
MRIDPTNKTPLIIWQIAIEFMEYGRGFDLDAYGEGDPFDQDDYGRCNLDRKSTSGGCKFLGNRIVSWKCKKQTTVSQSTAKAKYISATLCCSQVTVKVMKVTADDPVCFAYVKISGVHLFPIHLDDLTPSVLLMQRSRVFNLFLSTWIILRLLLLCLREDLECSYLFNNHLDIVLFTTSDVQLDLILLLAVILTYQDDPSTTLDMDFLFVKRHNVCAILNTTDSKNADFIPILCRSSWRFYGSIS